MSAHPLDKVFPTGEIVYDWGEDFAYMRGVTRRQAERLLGDVDPVWVVAYSPCPEWESEQHWSPESDDEPQCCGGECEGGPVWQVVKDRVPGARRAWRSA